MDLYGNEYLVVGGIVFLAALTQSITGFGFAIVSMSFLPKIVDLQTAVPLVALVGVALNGTIWFYHRHNCNFKAVRRLTCASLIATPVGIFLLANFSEAIALKGLGFLVIGYVLYDCLNLALPSLKSQVWVYVFGSLSGMLNGAYAVGGPPAIVYANCRHWIPIEFKANLSALFFFNALSAAIAHGYQGNLTFLVSRFAIYSLPGFALGLWLGVMLYKRVNSSIFKRIALTLLLISGFRLLI